MYSTLSKYIFRFLFTKKSKKDNKNEVDIIIYFSRHLMLLLNKIYNYQDLVLKVNDYQDLVYKVNEKDQQFDLQKNIEFCVKNLNSKISNHIKFTKIKNNG